MPDRIGHLEVRDQRVGDEMIVYTAFDPNIGRQVTVKEPLPHLLADRDFVASFLEEGRRLATIQDDNVVTLYQILAPGEVDDKCYLVLEATEQTVEDLLARGAVERALARQILRDALSGLRAIHDAGMIHANLRPSSLLVTAGGRAKVTDLRAAWGAGRKGTLLMGASLYLAPEFWRENGRVGPWSDLYGLGCVGYEMLVGTARLRSELQALGAGDAQAGAWHADESLSAVALTEIDAAIERDLAGVVGRLMEKRIERRYQNAAEALAALRGDSPAWAPQSATPRTRVVAAAPANGTHDGRTRVVGPPTGTTRVVSPGATSETRTVAPLVEDRPWWKDALVIAGVAVVGLLIMFVIVALS